MIICSQTETLVPLDKVVYALRDVTGTVKSLPLIAVSIMSKKIACGTDKILIDIKYGEGALIPTEREARELKDIMIRIGENYEKEVRCLISDMNNPLGCCVGNALEVAEACELLDGKVKNNLYNLCVDIASNMVSMAKEIQMIEARSALMKFDDGASTIFEGEEIVISGTAGQNSVRFTILFWLEGDDPDCNEDILGKSAKFELEADVVA